MSLRILGPIELVANGAPVHIGGPREIAVLATLALRAGRAVPMDVLVDAVWGDRPPTTARSQVQGCISGLRRLFADVGLAATIRTSVAGYLLDIPPELLDAARFSRHVARAQAQSGDDDEAAARTLTEALALWRGSALQGVASEHVRRAAAILDDARLAAVEEHLRLELALGRHHELIGELRGLIADHPLHERFTAFLALALYRAQRPVEALQTLRGARTVLVEELGLDPGRELRDLEVAMLNRDPRLDAPALPAELVLPDEVAAAAGQPAGGARPGGPGWPVRPARPDRPPGKAARPSAPAPRTGALPLPAAPPPAPAARHDAGPAPAPPPAAVAVRPGPRQLPRGASDFVGREEELRTITRLLRDPPGPAGRPLAAPVVGIYGPGGVGKTALALRAAHEVADAFPDGQLYVEVGDAGDEDRTAAVLAGLLRALGVPDTAIPWAVDERAALYRSRIADRQLLLVVDGAADEAQLLPLLPGSPCGAVLLTARSQLGAPAGARWLRLEVFDPPTAHRMLAAIVGAERLEREPEAVDELVGYSDGLPLALRIAGSRLAARPTWRVAELARRMRHEVRRLDEFRHRRLELRSCLRSSYRSLPEQAKQLLRLCALVQAPHFAAWTAGVLLDTPVPDAERALDQLVDVQLLDAVQGGTECRYRLHYLVRLYARERLAEDCSQDDRDAALRRLFGAWLWMVDRADRGGPGSRPVRGPAARFPVPGFDDALVEEQPPAWLDEQRAGLVAAVRQAWHEGHHDACWDLALAAARVFEVRGLHDDWREAAELALQAARKADDRLGTAAARYSLGALSALQGRPAHAAQHFAEALDLFRALGHRAGETLVLRAAAGCGPPAPGLPPAAGRP